MTKVEVKTEMQKLHPSARHVSSLNYMVETIDHKFLVSGHSYLLNDQDIGLLEKYKKYLQNVYVPSDWVQVVREARKKHLLMLS